MKTFKISSSRPQRANPSRRRNGQALLELAFVITILLGLTMGLIQYGIIYNTSITLTNLAREGARFAAIHGTESDVLNQVRDYVQQKAANGTTIKASDIPDSKITITTASRSSGQPITVQIEYDMRKKIFIKGVPGMNRSSWSSYKTTATMVIE